MSTDQHTTKTERAEDLGPSAAVTCNGVIYTEGEPGKCWVAEDHTTITDPEIIAMLEGALFQAILKGNDPAPTQGDQQ